MESVVDQWADVEKTYQDEGPYEIMPIAYSIECNCFNLIFFKF